MPNASYHFDGQKFAENMLEFSQSAQSIWLQWGEQLSGQWAAANQSAEPSQTSAITHLFSPEQTAEVWGEMTRIWMERPEMMMEAQNSYMQGWLKLMEYGSGLMAGESPTPPVSEALRDRRFRDEAWQQQPFFAFTQQAYAFTSKWMDNLLQQLDSDLEPETLKKLTFLTRQWIDAASPSNFAMTNPEVLRATIESHGENFLKGLENLQQDIARSGQAGSAEMFDVSMTDLSAFKVGENIATTPGEVIFRNELMELIQYTPAAETANVQQTPLLIIPPWINKYYILDLQPKNSFVKFAIDQGFTVFMVSWVNPTLDHAHIDFENYMKDGILAAMEAIERATGESDIHVLGYCLGGTLLACTLAWLKEQKNPPRTIASATFLTTLLDFSEPGDISVFLGKDMLEKLEKQPEDAGVFSGREMSAIFRMLRANDLIWSFVVQNYLLGKEPPSFDLLFWNADSTNLPTKMHQFYLRYMYGANALTKPGGIRLLDTPINLRQVTTPSYFLSTKEDHIAPWESTFSGLRLLDETAPATFVLSGSGHVAGVINPPIKQKYGYWVEEGEVYKTAKTPDATSWLDQANHQEGSWWPHWVEWLGKQGEQVGQTVEATSRKPKSSGLGKAPGTYVMQGIDD